MSSALAFAIIGTFAAFAAAGAIFDLRSRTIPNLLCLPMAIAGLAGAAALDGGNAALIHLAHLVVALLIGMGIYALKWWGGGDAKFYAATSAWFPITDFFVLLFWISLAGVFLVAAAYVRWKSRRREGASSFFRREKSGLPYGVAIAAGGLLTLTSRALL